MDLETENRLAALLMEEARRLRLQAEKEGVHVYLRQPNVRGRPNSRFLTATVLGVQQANRAAEEGEMWRARDKELELDSRLNNRSKHRSKVEADKHHSEPVESHSGSSVPCSTSKRSHEDKTSSSQCLSSKRAHEDSDASENGMGDEDIERFLHSRVKRGRGAVGSRMDEPGPYLSTSVNDGKQQATSSDTREREDWERRILGPEKPSFLQTKEQLLMDANHSRNVEYGASSGTKKHHSKKHSTRKEKSEKMKRKEKQSKDKQKSRSTR